MKTKAWPWWIVDRPRNRGGGGIYVQRSFATEAEAQAVLDDLLRGYPAGHEWRERLVVEQRVATAAMDARIERRESGKKGRPFGPGARNGNGSGEGTPE